MSQFDKASEGTKSKADAEAKECLSFRSIMANAAGTKGEASRGMVYSQFLYGVADLNHVNGLKIEDVQNSENSPCLNDADRKMLKFTEENFKSLTRLDPMQASPKEITIDTHMMIDNYPKPKLVDSNDYRDQIASRMAIAGVVLGVGAEGAAYVFATPYALAMSTYGAAGLGGVIAVRHDNLGDGLIAGTVLAPAWGPAIGAFAGYGVGDMFAESYWNMTQRRNVKSVYKGMQKNVPTYQEYQASLR